MTAATRTNDTATDRAPMTLTAKPVMVAPRFSTNDGTMHRDGEGYRAWGLVRFEHAPPVEVQSQYCAEYEDALDQYLAALKVTLVAEFYRSMAAQREAEACI